MIPSFFAKVFIPVIDFSKYNAILREGNVV